jgi:hypothetical protein
LKNLDGDRNKLVIDLSCRRVGQGWRVAMDKWQTITEFEITQGKSHPPLSDPEHTKSATPFKFPASHTKPMKATPHDFPSSNERGTTIHSHLPSPFPTSTSTSTSPTSHPNFPTHLTLTWPKKTPPENILLLEPHCSEFLIHAADAEGLQAGIDEALVEHLAAICTLPVTYAGGGRNLQDLELVERLSGGKVDLTIGSALDIFGGRGVRFEECVGWNEGR